MHTQVHLESTIVRTTDIRRLLREFPTLLRKTTTTTQINFPVQHTILTVVGQPVRMATRRRSPLDNQRINQAVKDMLDKDIIEPSSSD